MQGDNEKANLHALLSTPVKCVLSLAELLRIRPELWKEIASCLTEQGVETRSLNLGVRTIPQTSTESEEKEPIPVSKVGQYQPKDEGNTSLPTEIANVVSIAILDSGAGISIATKTIWEKWEKPSVRRTRMNLQLADGSLENPIGLLENVKVKSCGI